MRHKEAPGVVNVTIWSIAVVVALLFVYMLISWLYSGTLFQISASTDTASSTSTCPAGTDKVAINNYLGDDKIGTGDGKEKNDVYTSKMGGYWKCSNICVPKNTGVETYLKGAKIGDKPVVLVKTVDEFIAKAKKGDTDLAQTIIYSKNKSYCEGVSADYDKITTADNKEVTVSTPNTTVAAFEAQQKAECSASSSNKEGSGAGGLGSGIGVTSVDPRTGKATAGGGNIQGWGFGNGGCVESPGSDSGFDLCEVTDQDTGGGKTTGRAPKRVGAKPGPGPLKGSRAKQAGSRAVATEGPSASAKSGARNR